MKLSQRSQNITPSATLALSAKAKQMKKAGADVINLTAGEPNFNTPYLIKKAAIAAIESGKSDFYTPALGIDELRAAIANFVNWDHKTNFDKDNVAVTVGGKFSLYAVAQVVLDPGDEVLIPLPYWVSYGEQVKLAGAVPVFVKPQAYKVTVEELEACRTPKTTAIIINSPQNPSGLIYTREELESIGNWAVEHDICLIADDMYSKLVYNDNEFVSLMDLSPAIRRQTILVNGFSKAYAMTGWRVGYTVADKQIIKLINAVVGHETSNIAAVSQYAALAAITGDQSYTKKMRDAYEERLNTLFPMLNAIPGFNLERKPEGAFYLFPKVEEAVLMCHFASTEAFVQALLDEAHVAVVPGSAFGMDEYIRLSYAASMEDLVAAAGRMKEFVEKHM